MFFDLQENQENFHIYVDAWPEKVQEGNYSLHDAKVFLK